jgi:hypothetical protein
MKGSGLINITNEDTETEDQSQRAENIKKLKQLEPKVLIDYSA